MNPAVATVIGAVVGGGVAIAVAILNTAIGRGGRRADIAQSVSSAWEPFVENQNAQMTELRTECKDCKTELRQLHKDFAAFADVMEELVPLLPLGEAQRKARVAISSARLAN